MKRLPPDPIAAVAGAALTLCGIFGIAELLNITGDQLAEAFGALVTLAATVRAVIVKRGSVAASA